MSDEAVQQFVEITHADAKTARTFLAGANGQVDGAVSNYMEALSGTPGSYPSAAGSGGGGGGRTLGTSTGGSFYVPLPSNEKSVGSAADGGGRGGRSQRGAGRGGIASLSDFRGDDEDDESRQRYYAGGGKDSGVQIEDPTEAPRKRKNDDGGKTDAVASFMDRMREQGAEEMAEGSAQQGEPSRPRFAGPGYRLGNTASEPVVADRDVAKKDQAAATAKTPEIRLTFYEDGFTVNDGPLRSMDDAAGKKFLEEVRQGRLPDELKEQYGGQNVDLRVIDSHGQKYTPPEKPKYSAYAGKGARLGSSSDTTPTARAPVPAYTSQPGQSPYADSARAPGGPPSATVGFTLDESKPSTSIQIRLADGTRLVVKMNLTHTVGDLYDFVASSRPDTGDFALLVPFPRQELQDKQKTIADAGLANAAVLQRML